MRRIARILLDDPTSLFRLPEGYPNFIPGDPSFYCPYEANPIYTSLTVTATYSGSRTKTIDNIVSKAITTIVYSGSVSWTWNRVYPSNYNNYDYNLFLTDPTMPARADEAYFGLGVSHDLSDDMNHLFGLINPKRQTLILQRGGYEGSPPLVVVGTQTETVEIPDNPDSPFITTRDILVGGIPSPPEFMWDTPQTFAGARWSPSKWGYSVGGGSPAQGENITTWSATKWRDYRGSYSSGPIYMDRDSSGAVVGWDSSDAAITYDWTLS